MLESGRCCRVEIIKFYFFFFVYLIFTNSTATERSSIIKILNGIDNIYFNFTQSTNNKIEKGNCILAFPRKLKCNYDDKNQKELIINRKIMSITKKRYGKPLFYPISKSTFYNILSKNELIKIINNSETMIDEYFNIVLVNKDNSNTLIRFDKTNFLLAGWVLLDQYNNQVIFEIEITATNQIIDDKIFALPQKG